VLSSNLPSTLQAPPGRLSTFVVEGTGEAHTTSGQPTGTLFAWGSLGGRAAKVQYTPGTGRVLLADGAPLRRLSERELKDLRAVLLRHSQSLPWVDGVTTQLLAGVEAALLPAPELSVLRNLRVARVGGMVMLCGLLHGRSVELVMHEDSQRLSIASEGHDQSARPLTGPEHVALARALAPYVAGTRADWQEFAALHEAALHRAVVGAH
jgi:hypothetical protein